MSASSRDTNDFFDQLTNQVLALRVASHHRLRPLSTDQLNRRPGYNKWSVGQCLEHLNILSGYYLPAVKARLKQAQAQGSAPQPKVRSGWLGRRLTSAARRTSEEDEVVQVPKQYAPTGVRLSGTVVEAFNRQLDELLRLLLLARQVEAGGVRVPNPLHPWLKVRLTDVFEMLVASYKRYVQQAEQTLITNATKAAQE
jgi:hypothetical protein